MILDIGSFYTEDFVSYAKREMGAKQALFIGIHGTNVPQHFFLKMHPTIIEGINTEIFGSIPPFHPEQIWQRLGRTYADITLSIGVIGRHDLWEIELWIRQLYRSCLNFAEYSSFPRRRESRQNQKTQT